MNDSVRPLKRSSGGTEHRRVSVGKTHHTTEPSRTVLSRLKLRHPPNDLQHGRRVCRERHFVAAREQIQHNGHDRDRGLRMEPHFRLLYDHPLDLPLLRTATSRKEMVETQQEGCKLALACRPGHVRETRFPLGRPVFENELLSHSDRVELERSSVEYGFVNQLPKGIFETAIVRKNLPLADQALVYGCQ